MEGAGGGVDEFELHRLVSSSKEEEARVTHTRPIDLGPVHRLNICQGRKPIDPNQGHHIQLHLPLGLRSGGSGRIRSSDLGEHLVVLGHVREIKHHDGLWCRAAGLIPGLEIGDRRALAQSGGHGWRVGGPRGPRGDVGGGLARAAALALDGCQDVRWDCAHGRTRD